jgi:heme exporter protein D
MVADERANSSRWGHIMRFLDFTSWQSLVTTLLGLVAITFVMVGIRLLVMQTVQQRRERENRQINERLRTLIAAYKTLGGSFTGDLAVDPTHLRDLMRRQAAGEAGAEAHETVDDLIANSSERSRRIRDAVEAALSDVILLGTEEQVRLAAQAASDMAAGRPTYTAELVISLRNFIRQVLALEAVPAEVVIPKQGPVRPSSASGKAKGDESAEGKGGASGGGKGSGAGGAGAMGVGGGMGLGVGLGIDAEDQRG